MGCGAAKGAVRPLELPFDAIGPVAATAARNQQRQQQPQVVVGSLNVPDDAHDPEESFHSYEPDGRRASTRPKTPASKSQTSEPNAKVTVYVPQDCLAQNPCQAGPPNRQMHELNIQRVAKFSDNACKFAEALQEEIDIRRSDDAKSLKVELPPGEPF
eukprot:TRINITY_DN11613_c0_g1_i3.p1 TRINITY_DN11613_c0_g1~~TRINITY_DN11613_c0_g1_i3.p1  ORF type:complete len:158 (-),score=44.26 TRINITY_DN11613_c0_g1_i3:42-515(-)